MSLYSQFGTNKEKEKKGVWIDIEGDYPDGKRPGFLLARMGGSNRDFEKAVEKRMRPFRQKSRRTGASDVVTSEIQEAITLDVFIDTVLIDWRNITSKNKKPMDFSAENAKKLFKDLPDLYVVLLGDSQDMKVFQDEDQGADAKN